MDEKTISRRVFLGTAVGAGTLLTQSCKLMIVPRHVLGGPHFIPPSEKLNIAIIGAGGRGADDLKGVSSQNIVALCDVDEKQAGKAFKDFPQARKYKDFREMLEKEHKNIEAVVVATPDHIHAPAAMMAIRMHKHVFCEKPLAHTIHEARELRKAAKKEGVATQMGIQGHASEGARLLCEWIWAGAIGPVREVQIWTNRPIWPQGLKRPKDTPPVPKTLDWNLWLGPATWRPYNPAYLPFKWRGWLDFGTGALGDIGCHSMDAAFWSLDLGDPISVEGETSEVYDETFPKWSTLVYQFPARGKKPPVTMRWFDGGKMPSRPPELDEDRKMEESGMLFIGDDGKIIADMYCESPRLIPEAKMQELLRHPPEKSIRRVKSHYAEWIEACKGGEKAGANFDYAGRLTEVVLLGNLAVRTGRKIVWDGPGMKVSNVPEANQYIRKEYREGWRL